MGLKLDSNVLSGTCGERTSPAGEYEGYEFRGVLQLILDSEEAKADGKWLGFNHDKAKINSGERTLTKA